jgi:hypothetical protein
MTRHKRALLRRNQASLAAVETQTFNVGAHYRVTQDDSAGATSTLKKSLRFGHDQLTARVTYHCIHPRKPGGLTIRLPPCIPEIRGRRWIFVAASTCEILADP